MIHHRRCHRRDRKSSRGRLIRLAAHLAVSLSGVFGVNTTAAADQPAITLVALGDSTTAPRKVGAGNNGRSRNTTTQGENADDFRNVPHNVVNTVNRNSPWLYVYSDVLRDELPSRGVFVSAVDNEGIGGTRTDEAIARIRSDVRRKMPECVIVQFGINDSWWASGQPEHLAHPDSFGSRVALDARVQTGGDGILGNGNDHPFANRGNYTDNLTQIVRTLRRDGARVVLMTPNQMTYSGDELWRNQLLGQYAEVVRSVSKAENVRCVDVWNLCGDYVTSSGRSAKDLLVDEVHPNAIAHRMIANALLDEIVDQIGPETRPSIKLCK